MKDKKTFKLVTHEFMKRIEHLEKISELLQNFETEGMKPYMENSEYHYDLIKDEVFLILENAQRISEVLFQLKVEK